MEESSKENKTNTKNFKKFGLIAVIVIVAVIVILAFFFKFDNRTTKVWISNKKFYLIEPGDYYSICGVPQLKNSSFEIYFYVNRGFLTTTSFFITNKKEYDRFVAGKRFQVFEWYNYIKNISNVSLFDILSEVFFKKPSMRIEWKPPTNESICFVFLNSGGTEKIINATIYEKGYNHGISNLTGVNISIGSFSPFGQTKECLLGVPFGCRIISFSTHGVLNITLSYQGVSKYWYRINRIACIDPALVGRDGLPIKDSYWSTPATGMEISQNPISEGMSTNISNIKCYASNGSVYSGTINSWYGATLILNYTTPSGAYDFVKGEIAVIPNTE